MANIFIECGTALASPFNTGIQRVVRSVVREADAVAVALGHRCIPVAFADGEFLVVGAENSPKKPSLENVKLASPTIRVRVGALLRRLPMGNFYLRLRNAVTPLMDLLRRDGALNKSLVANLMSVSYRQHMDLSTPPNILLLLDSTWDTRMWRAVDEFRASGGHVCAVLYDLIPFSHPDTVEEHTRKAHTSWWLEAPLHLDSVICISQTVRKEFLAWQEEYGLARRIPPERVTHFYLGAELREDGNATDCFSGGLGLDEPYYLVVGSIEPRKNHTVILDAFEMLWRDGRAISLVIVGGHGWKCEPFLERVYNHPMFNKKLILVRQATDAELAFLYSNASALVFASFAEGFGLPIVEAFQRGARVICSDIPVFREVAGEQASYFEPNDAASLASQIEADCKLFAGATFPESGTARYWLTWKESVEQLFSRVIDVCG